MGYVCGKEQVKDEFLYKIRQLKSELAQEKKKYLDILWSSVILKPMNETKVTESEITKSIEDYLDGCSKQELIDLHNFIFSEYISDLDDVEWGE